MKKYLLIPVLFAFVACSTVKVAYDYDKQADFSKYKTYAISEETTKMANVNQLNRDRIINAVEAEMAAKGFTKAGDNADVILDIGKERVVLNFSFMPGDEKLQGTHEYCDDKPR